MPLAILLIFVLLVMSFGRVRSAALIILNVPFSLIGGIFPLFLSGQYLSAPSRVRRLARGALLVGTLAACRSAPDTSEPSPAREPLEALFARAVQAVREDQDVRLDGIALRVVTLEEMTDSFYRESFGRALEPEVPEEDQDARRQAVAELFARGAYARYSNQKNEILIRLEAFEEFAKLLGMPELDSDQQILCVLLHEVVHAAQEERFHLFSEVQNEPRTVDAGRAYNAVVEGHAQFVARRLADGLGLSQSFETYTRSLSATVAGKENARNDPGILTIYLDGERFVSALDRAGGEEAIRRAFSAPPEDLATISHPDWYLEPETRPRGTTDLEAGLDELSESLPDDWWEDRVTWSEREFVTHCLAPLPEEEIAPIAKALRQNRVLQTGPGQDSLAGEITLFLFEFDSTEGSRRFMDTFVEVRRLRDDARKEGPVRSEGAVYVPLKAPDPEGVQYEKTLVFGETPARALGVCITRGCVVVQLLLVNVDWDKGLVLQRAKEVLQRVTPLEGGR